MTSDQQWALLFWGNVLIQFALPCLLMLVPMRALRLRFGFLKVVAVTLGCWFLANVCRMNVEFPVCIARARAAGNEIYDGVGGNVAIMLLGWLFPFVVATLTWVAGSLVRQRDKP